MASETDIKRMLIDALRPSLFEVVKQELTPLAEVRAEIAKSEAALHERIDDLSSKLSGQITDREATLHERIDDLSSKLSGQITDRIDVAVKELRQQFEQEIEARLAGVKAQVVLNQAALDVLGDDLKRAQAGATARADHLDRRLGAAAAALRNGAEQPVETAAEPRHAAAGE
jgi:hypothetical protein